MRVGSGSQGAKGNGRSVNRLFLLLSLEKEEDGEQREESHRPASCPARARVGLLQIMADSSGNWRQDNGEGCRLQTHGAREG